MLDLVFRNELPPIVVAELDQQLATLNAYLLEQHHDDGTHAAVTADSLTLRETQQAPTTTGYLKFIDRFNNQARLRLTGTAIDQSYLDMITAAGSRVRLFVDGTGTTPLMTFGALESSLSMGLLGGTVRITSGFEDWGWGVGRDSFDDFMAPISFTGAETPFKIYRDNASSIFQVSPPDFGVYTHYLGNPAQSKFDWDKIAGKEVYARTAYYERARSVALGEWAAYTPTWTSDGTQPAIGAGGVLSGRYTLIGKTCHFQIRIVMASTTTFGTGNYFFSMPVTAATSLTSPALGSVWMVDAGTTIRIGTTVLANGTDVLVSTDNSGGFVGSTNPFTWADNDQLYISGTFEIA